IGFESGLSLWEIQEGHPIREKLTIDNFDSTRIELYFETEDIDRMFDLLKVQQVAFFHEIHEESWGQRTIRFFDPDHHLIEIGEPIPTFVKRLSKTLSPEEVSQKTSVSIEEVNKILSEHD
nr:hypothetical protein [Bacteroidota bacterium]